MKKIPLNVIAFIFVMLLSCGEKSAPPDPFADNEIKATISVDGAAPILCESKGNATLFVRRTESNGTIITTIVGCSQVNISLANISSPGTYFIDSTLSGQNSSASCQYIVGNPYAPTDMFFSSAYKQNTGNLPGTVVIESVSSSYIKGTFSAFCMNNTGKQVRITNGSFKGNF